MLKDRGTVVSRAILLLTTSARARRFAWASVARAPTWQGTRARSKERRCTVGDAAAQGQSPEERLQVPDLTLNNFPTALQKSDVNFDEKVAKASAGRAETP